MRQLSSSRPLYAGASAGYLAPAPAKRKTGGGRFSARPGALCDGGWLGVGSPRCRLVRRALRQPCRYRRSWVSPVSALARSGSGAKPSVADAGAVVVRRCQRVARCLDECTSGVDRGSLPAAHPLFVARALQHGRPRRGERRGLGRLRRHFGLRPSCGRDCHCGTAPSRCISISASRPGRREGRRPGMAFPRADGPGGIGISGASGRGGDGRRGRSILARILGSRHGRCSNRLRRLLAGDGGWTLQRRLGASAASRPASAWP